MSNYVFLIDQAKNVMNPIHPVQAQKLMDEGKAAVFRRFPFTLIMQREIQNIKTHPLSLRIDPGSKTTGIALVSDRGEVIWGMELTHRGPEIKGDLQSRAAIRRGRRSRHTRYRQARFNNRTRPDGWLPPSLLHRVLTIETWVKRLIKFAPIGEIRQELVKFDMQKMDNPDIEKAEYQQGTLAGYTVREYLLEKWGRECTYCGKKDVPLQIEHMQAKANGGSNRISNLCLACEKCNTKKGTKRLEDFVKDKAKLKKLQAKAKAPLKDAAAVNATRWKLFETLKATGLPVLTGSGALTKFNRTRLNLPKEHWIDAACVGEVTVLTIKTNRILKVKCAGHGNRQFTRVNAFGFPCTAARTIRTHCKTGDIVAVTVHVDRKHIKTGVHVGRIKGTTAKSADVQIGKHRIQPEFQDITFIHRSDGYRYE